MRREIEIPDDIISQIPEADQFSKQVMSQAVRRARLVRLAQRGLTATQAAKVLNCSAATVHSVYKDPAFRRQVMARVDAVFGAVDDAYATKQLTLHERISEKGGAAFDTLVQLLETSENESLKAKIAMDILDRVPEAQPQTRAAAIDPETLRTAAESAAVMDNVLPMKRRA